MRRREFLQTSMSVAGATLAFRSIPLVLTFAGVKSLPGVAPASNSDYDRIRQVFENPPGDNRNWTRWWWFGPQATEQGISYELQRMQEQGLAGVEINWMTPLEPDGNFEFLSDRWAELTKFTVQKAKRLGLRMDLMLGAGWPCGGPWIPIELGSKCILKTDDDVIGPDPYGVKIPGDVGEHEKLIALFAAQTVGSDEVLDPRTIIDLRPYLRYTDPKFWAVVRQAVGWRVPQGRWKIIALKQVPTRQAVRAASLGGEGLVIDHFSRKSLDRHLDVVGGAFKKVAGEEFGKTVRGIFCDSFEIHVPHHSYYWTDNYLEEFEKRKGYDLSPHLLALWYDVGEKTPYLRHDFIHVLSQLIIDNFFLPLRKWCEQNGLKSRVQAHGSIGELLESYASNTIGEGEQVTLREPQVSVHRKHATSSAYIYGKPLVSAESFTFLSAPGYPSSYRYTVNLELMKSVLDPGLRDGYQEIVSCGYAYNDPDEKTEPFQEMFASAVVRHTEPWWQYYHHFTSYVGRCCSLLSQGRFVADVAVLSPIPDAWSRAGPSKQLYWRPEELAIEWGDIAPLVVRNGYDFNFVNDQVLVERSSLQEGKLVIEKIAHAVLILPRMTYVSLKTMERVRDFCRGGGLVIALERLPEYSTGFVGYEENGRQLRAIVREMFGSIPLRDPIVKNEFGRGEVVLLRSETDLPKILHEKLQPDFELEKPAEPVLHLHRRGNDSEVYFVTNTSEFYQENSALFRTARKSVELWNAETGQAALVAVFTVERRGVRIPLRLKPYESVFYVFRDTPEPRHLVETNADEVAVNGAGKVLCTTASNGTVYIRVAAEAERRETLVKDLPAPFEITGEWLVTFQAYKFPKLTKRMPVLHSWSDDSDTRNFSGTARYELEFEIPTGLLEKGRRVTLDLGTVMDASKVWLNSQSTGVTWKRPHLHDVTRWVKPGANFLEVRVSNRLINYVAGLKRPEWADKVVEKYGDYNERRRWYEVISREYGAPNIPPAGLLGPVRLVFAQELEFEI